LRIIRAMYKRKIKQERLTPFDQVMVILGNKWNSRLLSIFHKKGVLRYNEIRKALPGISDPVLSNALRILQAEKIVSRKQYEEVPLRVEYGLTDRGQELVDLCKQICAWGFKYYPGVPEEERPFGDPE